uniref:SFRICE_025376 n=1 Tax=Spodoptera frugiperda TaxID=7108 RepID=A0A2H1WVT2_SPOFR
MRKLRNLWTSHKKYCTTITPLRSYTPLSGYPHSRSSYDLDRTYYTSTPNYRSRFRRADSLSESSRDDVGGLTRNLSDLSIDKIDDSDDDPVKCSLYPCVPRMVFATWLTLFVCVCSRVACRQELATLQRQVNGLSRSMQSPHNTPSNFQAHPPHKTTTDRNVPHSPSDSGRDYPGTESTGHTTHGPDARVTTVDRDDPYQTAGINETPYQEEEHHDQTEENVVEDIKPTETVYQEPEHFEEEMSKVQTEAKEEIKEEPEKPMEVEHTEAYETQQYDEYDQNYEQTPATGDVQYENQFENYEQQPYADQQYENYEQYPQEAADPNAQYQQEYENYPTDGNYTDQNYDTTQYAEGITDAAHDGSKNVQDNVQSYDAQYAQEYESDQNAKIQEKVPESIKSQEKPSSQS